MLFELLKKVSQVLPARAQNWLRVKSYMWQIKRGRFAHDEPEFAVLGQWVQAGDVAMDIGANVGRYTVKLAELVGPEGHVFSIEPYLKTFRTLSRVVLCCPHRNVTLINGAASDTSGFLWLQVPRDAKGRENMYEAHVTKEANGLRVFSFPVDALGIPGKVTFCKVDVEGHELEVLRGMQNMLRVHRPTLVVEGSNSDVAAFLRSLGYQGANYSGSPNTIFLPVEGKAFKDSIVGGCATKCGCTAALPVKPGKTELQCRAIAPFELV